MMRRIRPSLHWFGAIAALLLLALPVQAGDIEPESFVEEAPEREPDWAVEAEAQKQAEIEAETAAANAGPSVGSKIFDCAILRPFGLAATILGGTFFVPAAVLASGSGAEGVQAAWETFVVAQVQNTFKRPLGDF